MQEYEHALSSYDDAVLRSQTFISVADPRFTKDRSESGEADDTHEVVRECAAHSITTEESDHSDAGSTTGDSDAEVNVLNRFVGKFILLTYFHISIRAIMKAMRILWLAQDHSSPRLHPHLLPLLDDGDHPTSWHQRNHRAYPPLLPHR